MVFPDTDYALVTGTESASVRFSGASAARHDYSSIRVKREPVAQMWIGFPVTAIAASLSASAWVGWAWQV